MENNKNKKSVKFQADMLNFCDFIQVFVFTRNHHLNSGRSACLQNCADPDQTAPVEQSDLDLHCLFTNHILSKY